MTEYIERDALIEHIKDLPTWWADGGGVYKGINMKYPDGMFDCDDVVSSIENAPAADVVPVVHGRWLDNDDYMFCSNCGMQWNYCDNDTQDFNCCPNCGARMDLGDKNND